MPEAVLPPADNRLLLAFDQPASVLTWSAVDDVVMGGLSSSRLLFNPAGHAEFSGTVSLANHGGFASVRTAPDDYAAPGALAFRLCVRGDGRRYKLNLRTDDAWDGVSYQAGFVPPAEQWSEVFLAIHEFQPSRRGRAVAAPAFDPGKLRRLGLMIADQQAGEFRLAIRWLCATGG